VKRSIASVVSMLALIALIATGVAARGAPRKTIPFEDASIIVEVNSTDGDAGLQFFLDGEPWRSIRIDGPDHRKVVDVAASGELKNFGLTELFSESNEPPFDELSLEEFKEKFPEGRYVFSGKTTEGQKLVGSAMLSHDIPDGPEIVSPEEDAELDPDDGIVIDWNPVTTPAGVEIVGYEVIVEREDPLRTFDVKLPASVTEVTISPEYLEGDTEYTFEVLAIEKSGNQTITQQDFTTT
jgi:hypothetical protein